MVLTRYTYIREIGLYVHNDYLQLDKSYGSRIKDFLNHHTLYSLGILNSGEFINGGYISVINYDKMPGQKPKPTFYKICKILKETDTDICFDGYAVSLEDYRNEIIGDFINE